MLLTTTRPTGGGAVPAGGGEQVLRLVLLHQEAHERAGREPLPGGGLRGLQRQGAGALGGGGVFVFVGSESVRNVRTPFFLECGHLCISFLSFAFFSTFFFKERFFFENRDSLL